MNGRVVATAALQLCVSSSASVPVHQRPPAASTVNHLSVTFRMMLLEMCTRQVRLPSAHVSEIPGYTPRPCLPAAPLPIGQTDGIRETCTAIYPSWHDQSIWFSRQLIMMHTT